MIKNTLASAVRRFPTAILLVTLMCSAVFAAVGCDVGADQREQQQVNSQQDIYNKNQPVPRYDWSLPRHLWTKFYDAQNEAVTTFSYLTPITGGAPMFDCASQGYPLPRDTQLTNPHQLVWSGHAQGTGVIDQAEPNGLFSSTNTDATIVFCQVGNGTVAPVYTELKVTAFPFPVKWETDKDHPQGHWVRAGDSSINIKMQKPAAQAQ